jgi:hypothetical protein
MNVIRHHESMTIVLIDTNAVHRDPWMRNDPGTDLLAAAAAGECRVVFPQVVVDEVRRQQSEWLKKHRKELAATIEDMRGNPVDVEGMAATLGKNLDDMQSQIDASFDALIASKGVEVAPAPADVTESLVARDLAVRRPFLEVGSEPWSTGFRDAVIWETALVVLDQMPEDEKLIFVTKDHGFLTDGLKSLHQDLLDDLDARGIPHDRVEIAQTTFAARAAAGKHAELAERVRVATDSLFELAGEEISERLVAGGDYGMPDFVQFELPWMENAEISGIDQLTEFVFEPVGAPEDGIVVGRADAELYLEGFTFKSDFPWAVLDGEGGESSLTLIEEVNDQYYGTANQIVVEVVATIDTSGGLGHYETQEVVLREKLDQADAPNEEAA